MSGGEDPRRVTLFIPRLHRGGAGKQVVHLATGLDRRGWDVDALTLLPLGEYGETLQERGVEVTTLGAGRGLPDPRVLVRCVRHLRRREPDVVVAFLHHATLAARLSVPLAGGPVLVSSVRNERLGGRLRRTVQRLLRPLDDLATVNSAHVARRLADRGILDPDRTEVVENAVDTSAYGGEPPPGLRASLDVGPDRVLWVAVGHPDPQKGYDVLVEAWGRVTARVPEAELRIAGEGPERSRLERRIRELGVGDTCRLLGARDDVPTLLAAADAFVLSSRWEGSPNAVMEAMASGLPVVATRVGGVPELLDSGEAGRLVPPEDPERLAEAMVEVSRAPAEERRRLGARARERVRERHGTERMLSRWEEILRKAIRERADG